MFEEKHQIFFYYLEITNFSRCLFHLNKRLERFQILVSGEEGFFFVQLKCFHAILSKKWKNLVQYRVLVVEKKIIFQTP